MNKFLQVALAVLFSTNSFAFGGMFDFRVDLPHYSISVEEMQKLEQAKREHEEALERANWFTLEIEYIFIWALEDELRAANAILLRNKAIFNRIRNEDSQDAGDVRIKTKKLFSQIKRYNDIPVKEIKLYEYEPTRDWINLAEYIWDTQRDTTTDIEEKIELVKARIRDMHETLIFLREKCKRADEKRQENNYKKNEKVTLWDLIAFLSACDIQMAVAKHNKDWEYYDHVAKKLDDL